MYLRTYQDESRCRHLDLISAGKKTLTIDLVSTASACMLVVGFVCALMVPFTSTVSDLSAWVH
jgi:hypothetical protein